MSFCLISRHYLSLIAMGRKNFVSCKDVPARISLLSSLGTSESKSDIFGLNRGIMSVKTSLLFQLMKT